MQTRELTKKEWQEVLSRFAVKPGEKTVRDFANEEGVGFIALTYRLYSCQEGAAARGKGEEVRLVPVDVSIRSGEEQEHSSRWLELETLRGAKLRFVEGTGGEYLADLMSRIAERGI